MMSLFWLLTGKALIAQDNPKVSKPKYGDMPQIQIAPNTIKVKCLIKRELKSTHTCRQTTSTLLEVEVLEVIASGSGLLHSISTGQHIQISLIVEKDAIQAKNIKQKPIIFILKEKLCQDMSQVLYESIELSWDKDK